MSAKTNKLLSLYRTYENLVRADGKDPKDLEAGMDGVLSGQMTMIRQFRNFLAHTESPGFLEPTDKMLAVLEAQVKAWSMKGDVAKKHAKQAAVCAASDKCVDVLAGMAKRKSGKIACAMPDGSYSVCDVYAVASAAVADKRSKMASVTALKEKPVFVAPDTPVREIDPDKITLCTADGMPGGKLAGAVIL